MKKVIKIITFVIFILLVIILYFRKEVRNKENSIRQTFEINEIIDIQIIDKYNLMQSLYDNPEEEQYIDVDVIINGIYYNNAGIRTKGNMIYTSLKRIKSDHYSYKLKLDYRDKTQKYKGISEFHINTTIVDPTVIREHTTYNIYNMLGIETQNFALGHLYIDQVDRGLVSVVEVINEEYVKQRYNSENGNLYKVEAILNKDNKIQSYSGANLKYIGENINNYIGIFSKIKTTNTTEEDKKVLINIIKKINETSETETIEKYFMDFDKIIKIVAVNKVLFSLDTFTGKTARNYYIYEEDGKIDILPFDFERTMNLQYDTNYWTENMNEYDLSKSDIKIYSRIIEIIVENDDFNHRYNKYLEDTRKLLKDINIEQYIDQKYLLVKDIVENNETKLYSIRAYKKEIERLKEFFRQRIL